MSLVIREIVRDTQEDNLSAQLPVILLVNSRHSGIKYKHSDEIGLIRTPREDPPTSGDGRVGGQLIRQCTREIDDIFSKVGHVTGKFSFIFIAGWLRSVTCIRNNEECHRWNYHREFPPASATDLLDDEKDEERHETRK